MFTLAGSTRYFGGNGAGDTAPETDKVSPPEIKFTCISDDSVGSDLASQHSPGMKGG